ncbi:MAG: hypothetical protein K6F09_03225 [Clostridiales bacterium]|nr:hypothetical protein [Clostridiales bacterium]
MKKVIALIIAIVVVAGAGVGVFLYLQSQTPEKQILGKWKGDYEIGTFEFKKDGIVTLGISNVSTDGEYEVDSENMVLSITYSVLGISYTRSYDFTIEDDKLSITDQTLTSVTLNYNRVTE